MNDGHNHQMCIDDALSNAKTICESKGAKLTQLREQVLILIWQSHKAMGAYTLIDMLAESQERRIAPPTVYRALDFLLELRLIHRINSINAYIGCVNPASHQDSKTGSNYFLICNQCHDTQEIISPKIKGIIDKTSQDSHFLSNQQWLEVTGLCNECQIHA